MSVEVLDVIVAAVASNAVALAILGFLFQSLINNYLSKDIETFKATLEGQLNSTIEAYKSELEKERIRLQISYGGIFEKQADAILTLFKLLTQLELQMELAIHAESNGTEYEAFTSIWRELTKFYSENKILLTKEIEDHFNKISKDIFWGVHDYRTAERRLARSSLTQEQYDNIFKKQDKALEILNEIPAMKDELTAKLRELIGVQSALSHSSNRF